MDDQYQHLQALRQAYLRRLQNLELKSAAFGLNTPPEIAVEIAAIQAKLVEVDQQLGPTAVRVLPAPVADFVGREDEITQLVRIFNNAAK